MPIPSRFQFSQASLQDYVDCPRRFYLRFIRRLAWPAVEAEPVLENERLMEQGSRFHTMVYQSLIGVPTDRLNRMVQDADLALWWRSIQEILPGLKSAASGLYPEVTLTAPLAGFTLLARCDLVVSREDGRLQIIDWKTARSRTRRSILAGSLQTCLYPYLLVRDGARFNASRPVQPAQVEMIYWFAGFPDQSEHFVYTPEQFQQDESRLESLIRQIAGLQDDQFHSSPGRGCRFCVYRSFCEQGVRAGDLSGRDDEQSDASMPDLDFDFDQIAEIEF